MTRLLIANILANLSCESDKLLLEACVGSLIGIADHIVIRYDWNSANYSTLHRLFEGSKTRLTQFFTEKEQAISEIGFAEARNELLAHSKRLSKREPFDMLWVDSDEVHFPDLAQALIPYRKGNFAAMSTHFVHFCITPTAYERFERRTNIVRIDSDAIHWENRVHEKLVGVEGSIYNSPYFYHHYGYCRGQEYVFKRWTQYALLEGQLTPYVNEEVDGITVPYFREGREGPSKILEDRKATLIPYHGEYPVFAQPFIQHIRE